MQGIPLKIITKDEADKMLKREKRVQQPKEIYCATGKIGTKEAEEIHRIDLLTGKKTLIFKKK